ncbi:MAG TPA: zinc dependent phospholipase C family protein [Anaerolineaceae bacterium]
MNTLTHHVIASRLISQIHPTNPAEYLWGSIYPDIRYPAKLRRETTHLPLEQLQEWISRYPDQSSFLTGYLVHCLVDKIDGARLLLKAFPLVLFKPLLKNKFSLHLAHVVIELFLIQTEALPCQLDMVYLPDLTHPPIPEALVNSYFTASHAYLASPSIETGLRLFKSFGLLEDSRLEKYLKAYHALQENRLMQAILFWSVRNARIVPQACQSVLKQMQASHT